MSKKTIIIFVSTFVIIGVIIFIIFSLINKKNPATTSNPATWYQNLNPFNSGAQNPSDNNSGQTTNNPDLEGSQAKTSFHQITNFAVSGASFFEDKRPLIKETPVVPETKTVILDPKDQNGRKEIQIFLNNTLSLNPPLVVDGNFGKKVTQAIEDFQKLKGLTTTGTIDSETAPLLIKTVITTVADKNQYELVPSLRYVERANGHIYKMFLDKKIEEKISNSTIPSIYESFFNGLGNTIVFRYVSSENKISSFVSTLGATAGEFLPEGISDLSLSPDKDKFFYLEENDSGVVGKIRIFGNTKIDTVFTSPLTEWLSQWATNKDIYLTTKASYGVGGDIFLLNTKNQTTSKVFGGIKGLTTLVNQNGYSVLYSESTGAGPRLKIFDTKSHTTKDLGIYGLPEKCVWSNNTTNIFCALPNAINGNQYPDIWYKGLISFDDYFVLIDSTTGDISTIANSMRETPIDATKMFLSDNEDTLFFVNKKDSTLWSLDLK